MGRGNSVAAPASVEKVKLFVAILYQAREAAVEAESRLEEMWGRIDYRGPDLPFDMTDYYQQEMGTELLRRLMSFQELVPPESLQQAKLRTNEVEAALTVEGKRRVNLDVGYLDHNKIVLGSVKYAGQKIHLGGGVYADLIARYRRGRYQPFEWTFPDFRDGRYDDQLNTIRRIYLQQRR